MKLNFSNARILVVGDAMVDRWVYGRMERISPEAPVPIFVQDRVVESDGGADNVQANLHSLGVPRAPLCAHYPCSVKTRYVVGNQHILRADEDASYSPSPEFADGIIRDFTAWKPHVLVISDYAKGVCTPEICQRLIKWANDSGVWVVVDPKGAHWSKYDGADIICPNEHEAWTVKSSINVFPNVLLTRGAKGITLFQRSQSNIDIPALKVEPKDVTGCGDSVVAALACALAVGIPLEEAARIANAAGAVAVSHAGTHAVTLAELEAML